MALLAIVAFWGATFELVQQATRSFSVLAFLAWRFSLATVPLALFAGWQPLHRRSLVLGAWIGVVLALAYVCQTFSLQQTDSTQTGMITGLFILFVPIFGWLFFGVRLTTRVAMGMVWSLLGLYLLVGPDSGQWGGGSALALLGAVGFGLHVALVDRAAERAEIVSLTLGQLAAAALIFWLTWAATRSALPEPSPLMPTRNVWLAALATGLIGSALGFAVQTMAQRHLSAIQVGVIIMTEPVFAAIVGRLAGERLTGIQWLGAAIMLGTTAWLGLAQWQASPANAPGTRPVPTAQPDQVPS